MEIGVELWRKWSECRMEWIPDSNIVNGICFSQNLWLNDGQGWCGFPRPVGGEAASVWIDVWQQVLREKLRCLFPKSQVDLFLPQGLGKRLLGLWEWQAEHHRCGAWNDPTSAHPKGVSVRGGWGAQDPLKNAPTHRGICFCLATRSCSSLSLMAPCLAAMLEWELGIAW